METQDTAQKGIPSLLQPLKNAIFGRQNERLEFIMDSYFKLSPEGRMGLIVGGVVAGILCLLAMIGVYLAALSSLQGNLEKAFESTNKISEARYRHNITRQKFSNIEGRLQTANQNLSLIPFLESKARELGITASGFPAQLPTSEIPQNISLSQNFQHAKVPFRIQNASLRRIIDYVVAVETSPHMLKVTDLGIKAQFQNKLYFDATITVEGTVLKR